MGYDTVDIRQPAPPSTEEWLPYRSVIRYAIGGGWGKENPETGTVPVRIIRGTDFKNIHRGNLQAVPLRYETSRRIGSRQLEDGDAILEISGGSRTSNQFTGRSFLVTQNLLDRLGGVVIPASFCRLVRFDEDRMVPKYAYYALQNMYLTGRAALYEQQSTGISNFQFEYFLDEEILRVPPLPEQRTIAQILGTLDDKIELNRQLNETLEELAKAIFKDWFIDFGPVRAKLEGRDTGLPEQLAALFPDRLVESELGEIPEGWGVKPVTALVSIVGGGTPKTSVNEYWGGDIPWFSVVDTPPPGSVYVVMTEKTITQKGLQESSARLVPEGTTIISARGTVGNLAMCGRPMAFNQSCYGLRTSSDVGDCFVFLTAHNLVDRLQAMAHGSVFSTITRQTIEAVSVAAAPRAVHLAFEATVRPFFSRIKVNVEEARILSQVRDVLLPKLVSGEVRVDVETP